MNLTKSLEDILILIGPESVMALLIILSVVSVAIILERAWFFKGLKDDLPVLAKDFQQALEKGVGPARKRLKNSPSAEAAVVLAGLDAYDRGPKAAEEAMEGASALQRMRLEARLVYLATLGNNAPFIGLFGTVIGVLIAFKELEEKNRLAAKAAAAAGKASEVMQGGGVMGAIAEALVATAVGIAVAIPAVAFYNLFQRMTKAKLANTAALSKILLSQMQGGAQAASEED